MLLQKKIIIESLIPYAINSNHSIQLQIFIYEPVEGKLRLAQLI